MTHYHMDVFTLNLLSKQGCWKSGTHTQYTTHHTAPQHTHTHTHTHITPHHTHVKVASDESAELHKGAWEVALSMLGDLVSDSGEADLYQGGDLDDEELSDDADS